ncbi:MAG: PEGA domain-containing protein [Deltaproteobacteria bacterium]|nr:PEGA domain-containing protein [Deltaproteobacteria bacterium]
MVASRRMRDGCGLLILLSAPLAILVLMWSPGGLISGPPVDCRVHAARTGRVEIGSTPVGALLSVDGRLVPGKDGRWVRTPVEELHNLQYGRSYFIRLEKEGFEPFEQHIHMDANTDGTTVRATLIPNLSEPDRSTPSDRCERPF